KVVPKFHAETGHVVLVFVSHDQEVDVAFAIYLRKEALEVLDRLRQVVGAAQRAAVDHHVKIAAVFMGPGNTAINTIAKTDVEKPDQKLICHCRSPVSSYFASPPIEKCGASEKRVAPSTFCTSKGGDPRSSKPSSPPTVSPII